MLFLLFQAGNDRYAISVSDVVEVLPLVEFKTIPHAPSWVVGVFNYRGTPVPAVDLTQLMVDRPSRRWMSTRIMVVKLSAAGSEERQLGLLAENVMETLRLTAADFSEPGITGRETRYLGPVAAVAGGLVQRVEVGNILTEDVRAVLYREQTD